jgi:hypothetical protein
MSTVNGALPSHRWGRIVASVDNLYRDTLCPFAHCLGCRGSEEYQPLGIPSSVGMKISPDMVKRIAAGDGLTGGIEDGKAGWVLSRSSGRSG